MPRFYETFTTPEIGSWIRLSEESSHHAMRVLRLRQGDSVELFDGNGLSIIGNISFDKQEVKVQVLSILRQCKSLDIVLIQALLNNEKLDWVIEKSCELGVTGIIVFSSARGEIKLTGDRLSKRLDRWKKIAISSCKQCGQNTLPKIDYFSSLEEALTIKKEKNFVLMPFTSRAEHFSQKPESVSFIVGPEGGLSAEELEVAKKRGWIPLKLGNLVMRTETAGLAAASFAQTLWGNWY